MLYEEEMIKNALYYPYIGFQDPSWVKGMALFYESIYRIVPDNIIPEDHPDLQSLLEDPAIGRMIEPSKYAAEASNDFFLNKDRWGAAAFVFGDEDNAVEHTLSRIHSAKTDEQVKQLFNTLGYGEINSDWFNVPTELASHYMLYLANNIAQRNQLNLITDTWAPWTATSYYNLDGCFNDYVPLYEQNNEYSDDLFALFSLMVGEITPLNILEIPGEEIIKFRGTRNDEICRFRNAIYDFYCELQKLEDPVVRQDAIDAKIKELIKAKEEYQKSADIIKAKGWFGVSFMGVSAPVTLGNLFNIPSASIITLGITSLALGGIFNIKATKDQLQVLQKKSPVSALVSMSNSFKRYNRRQNKEVGMNYLAYDCMEEFVND
jgi:hypothetical protein